MATYDYQAHDAQGRRRRGTQDADNPRQARQLLRARGLQPTRISEAKGSGQLHRARLRRGELALLARQLATLVQAGLPLEQALRAVAEQSARPAVHSLLQAVRGRVLEGQSLAQALGLCPRVFPELFRTTVAAGERSGHLGAVLEQLARYTEARQESAQRIQMALVYPCILLCASLAIVGFLLGYVVPDVIAMFIDSGRALPALTQGLIHVSHAARDHGLTALGLVVVAAVALRLGLQRPAWRRRVHDRLLALPCVGPLWRATEAARFASTLSIMGRSAVPLVEALQIAASVVGHLGIRARLLDVARSVSEGDTLARGLTASGDIPPMMLHLIASGEQAGELDQLLEHAARQQEKILAARIALLVSLFEPLMLVLMGGVVMLIVLAILLPILSLNQLVT
jgi:general secretion pathway protein F